jgi:hypothetical protein
VIARAFSPAYQTAAAARLKLPERATAVALLLLLHAALFLLISPKFGVQEQMRPVNEVTLSFQAPRPRELAPPAVTPVFVRPSAPIVTPPAIVQSALPSLRAAPDITGIGRSLFNCDLANSGNLLPEYHANCLNFGTAPPASGMAETGMPKRTKVKHGVTWAAELAARQAPPEVPCTSLQQQVFGGPGAQKPVTTLMADPLCLLNGLLNGFSGHEK